MIDLAGRLPNSVKVGRRRYRLHTEFFRVLRCFEIMRDSDILPEHQVELCLQVLLRRWFIPRSYKARAEIMQAITSQFIAPDKSKRRPDKSMDLTHDAPYIFAAFWQAYGVDLTKSRMHWWVFGALLGALPDDTKMSQIVGIRQKPMPKATKYNAEDRARLARLKAEWAVYKSPEERERDLQEGLKKLALAMHSMTKGGR